MNKWFKSGSPWIWLSAGGVSISLISVLGLLWLIASRGLSYFWPSQLHQFDLIDENGVKSVVIGEIYDREEIPVSQLAHLNLTLAPEQEVLERLLIKTGNRELVSLDFRWLLSHYIVKDQTPKDLVVVERRTNGNFYGYIDSIILDGKEVPKDRLAELLSRVESFQEKIDELQKSDIGAINHQLERLRLKKRKYQLEGKLTPEVEAQLSQQKNALNISYEKLEKELLAFRKEISRDQLVMRAMDGQLVTINFDYILDVSFNNNLNFLEKLSVFFSQVGGFIMDDPREANTEGGVFPAIFGTVLMVLLMTVIVSPFGVIAAIYLHEYAGKNALTKLLRIAVINLAGVPSIVYGVFGLGFFVYMG